MAIPFAIGAFQMGAGMLESYAQQQQAEAQVAYKNEQTRLSNQAAMQEWQYNEQMRQIQQRQREQIYEMAKEEYSLQKELNLEEYANYFEDAQIDFNNLVRDAVNQTLALDTKAAQAKGAQAVSNASRGVEGTRSRRSSQAVGLQTGMMKTNLNERLLFSENMMKKDIDRAATQTDLRNKLAFNAIGPAPEALPVAPLPVMGAMQSAPSNLGMYTGMLNSAMAGLGTWDQLSPTGAFNQRA